MRRKIGILATTGATVAVIAIGLHGGAGSQAALVPTACAVASVDAMGTATTVTYDSDGMTCPTVPAQDPSNPCPDGDDVGDGPRTVGTAEYFFMVCVKGL